MSFDETVLSRLRRYRGEADRALGEIEEVRAVTLAFADRLYGGLEHVAALAREAGFEFSCERQKQRLTLGVEVVERAPLTLGVVGGAAGEVEEELMHPQLSRWTLEPSGYSGRIAGWSGEVGEDVAQVFAVYADGLWRTRGFFVERSQGRVDDADEVLLGFCLRIAGRLIDVAALTGGAGRSWACEEYSLSDYLGGREHSTRLRPPR